MEKIANGSQVKEVRSGGSVENVGLAWISGLVRCASVACGAWLGLGTMEEKQEKEPREKHLLVGFDSHFFFSLVLVLVSSL